MENRITVNICGEEYTFVAEESPSYMQKVAGMVDAKMGEILAGGKVSRTDAAVLAAMNIADDYMKHQNSGENLRAQLKSALDEASKARAESSELKREIFRLQQRMGK